MDNYAIGELPLNLYLLQQTIGNDSVISTPKLLQRMQDYLSGNFSDIYSTDDSNMDAQITAFLTTNLSSFFNEQIWSETSALLSSSIYINDIETDGNKLIKNTNNIFYETYTDIYDEIKTNNFDKINNYINIFNNNMNALTVLSNWTPALTNCLIEPMKIIINFGQATLDINTVNSTFDIDIKVNINDPLEKNNAIGWRCGSKSTKYLSWISGDSQVGRTRNCFS